MKKNLKWWSFYRSPIDNATKKLLDKNLQTDGIACVIGGGSSLSNYADLDLFKEIPNKSDKYAVFVDGDNGDETKQKEKEKIKARCNNDGALFCKMPKREIENYCRPEKIKSCYVDNIKKKEGEDSQNPCISEIEALEIEITDDIDVEKYLKDLGLSGFKSGNNINIFNSMTKKEWEKADTNSEIKEFIESVYSKI
ncbi:MAG: hypothetical protein U9R20_03995 [Thermodesulfobacteriota bacterium]|nr:hypothetical protein [Thermodesulfobacteriota bacterium]